MIRKKVSPTEIQNIAWQELQKGGPRGGGGKLSTKTMKVKDVEAPKKKKKEIVKKKKKGFLELRGLA